MYYLGFGFAILLAWGACVPDRALDAAAGRPGARPSPATGDAYPARRAGERSGVVEQVG